MTAQHTPVPWAIHTFDLNTGDQGGVRIVGADGTTIADNETYYPHALDPANAEFIARAVNSHELMLDALMDALRDHSCDWNGCWHEQAREAIRAATGEDA